MGFQATLSSRRTDIIVWSVVAVVMILVTVGIVCLTKAGSSGSSSTGADLTVRQPGEETSLQPEAAGAEEAGSTGANEGEESTAAVSPHPPAPSPPPPPPPPRDPTSKWQDRSRAFNFPGQVRTPGSVKFNTGACLSSTHPTVRTGWRHSQLPGHDSLRVHIETLELGQKVTTVRFRKHAASMPQPNHPDIPKGHPLQ